IVKRALAKDPEVRYPTAIELLADLPESDSSRSRIHHQPRVANPALSQADTVVVAKKVDPQLPPNKTEKLSAASWGREEPIWKFLKEFSAELGYAWNNKLNTATKVILLVVGFWLFLFSSAVIIPALVFIVVVYLCYRAIWTLVTWSLRDPSVRSTSYAPAADAPAAGSPAQSGHNRRRWHTSRFTLPQKPNRQKVMELFGSMFLSGVVCLVISVVMLLLRGNTVYPEQFAWLALVTIVGTWGILVPAKLWEGNEGEPALRRFSLLVVGMAVGAVAYVAHEQLMVTLPHEFTYRPVFSEVVQNGIATQTYAQSEVAVIDASVSGSGVSKGVESLSLMTCLSYFGFLFLLIRWWRLADPLRISRLSLWTTAVCVTWAGALFLFWPLPASWNWFPQPWGVMVAATVAVAGQLGSPWLNPKRRSATATT
ncbi:MAG: hypothetical protein N2C12_00120, partial [Planctomycetales bacterium]